MRGRSHMNVRLPMAYHPASTCRIPSITHKILDFAVSILVNWKIIPIVDSVLVFHDSHGEIPVFVDEKTRDLMILMVKITQILTLSALEGTTTIVGVGLSPKKSPQVHIQHQGHHIFTLGPQQWVSLSSVIVGRGITRNKGSNDQPCVGETHTAETKNP